MGTFRFNFLGGDWDIRTFRFNFLGRVGGEGG